MVCIVEGYKPLSVCTEAYVRDKRVDNVGRAAGAGGGEGLDKFIRETSASY